MFLLVILSCAVTPPLFGLAELRGEVGGVSSSSDVMSISVPRTDCMLCRALSNSWREFRKRFCLSRLDGSSITLLAVETIFGMAKWKKRGGEGRGGEERRGEGGERRGGERGGEEGWRGEERGGEGWRGEGRRGEEGIVIHRNTSS